MAPFIQDNVSEQQKLADASLLIRLKPERRQSLERRLSNGRSKEEELAIIESIKTNVREMLESRIRGGRSKNYVFMSAMFHWYQQLDPKKKLRLTPRQLKRQALAVCREYVIVYNTLPRNWVSYMMSKWGMRLFEYKNREELLRRCREKKAAKLAERSKLPNELPMETNLLQKMNPKAAVNVHAQSVKQGVKTHLKEFQSPQQEVKIDLEETQSLQQEVKEDREEIESLQLKPATF